ncbi:MAG TPA: hypothetical protein VHF22_09180, partial [Planctomycetota bacterium]|nr:hypothetical protein [Planctomycetota bacterium]
GALAGVALVAAALGTPSATASQQLERRLRRHDFVAALSPTDYVLVAADVRPVDLDGLKRRFGDAVARAAGCDASHVALRVAFAPAERGAAPRELVKSLLEQGERP